MKKVLCLLGMILLSASMMFAQKNISGRVTNKADSTTLPGVAITVKGTTTGTVTDIDGKYKISVPSSATTLVFSFIGMKSQEVEIGAQTIINVALELASTQIEGVVVTALGISRDKKSLGYSTQELKGDLVSNISTDNVTNALSGKWIFRAK